MLAKIIYHHAIPPFMRPFALRIYQYLLGKKPTKNNDIIMIGAGGHAKVCIELLWAMGEHVAYCVGDAKSADLCMGVPVNKTDLCLPHLKNEGYHRAFIAIGDNKLRRTLAKRLLKQGYQLVNAISPHAVISSTAILGSGIAVMAGVVINAQVIIDDLAIINTGASLDHDCKIGAAAHIGPQCGLAGNVHVGAGSFLGVGCSVIPNICIGDNVIVGAGAAIIKNLPNEIKVAGVPAKELPVKIRELC